MRDCSGAGVHACVHDPKAHSGDHPQLCTCGLRKHNIGVTVEGKVVVGRRLHLAPKDNHMGNKNNREPVRPPSRATVRCTELGATRLVERRACTGPQASPIRPEAERRGRAAFSGLSGRQHYRWCRVRAPSSGRSFSTISNGYVPRHILARNQPYTNRTSATTCWISSSYVLQPPNRGASGRPRSGKD